jgi:hypothetical protein
LQFPFRREAGNDVSEARSRKAAGSKSIKVYRFFVLALNFTIGRLVLLTTRLLLRRRLRSSLASGEK